MAKATDSATIKDAISGRTFEVAVGDTFADRHNDGAVVEIRGISATNVTYVLTDATGARRSFYSKGIVGNLLANGHWVRSETRAAGSPDRAHDEAAAPVTLKPCDNCGVGEAVEPADFCHDCIQRDRAISGAGMTPMQRLVRNALIQAEVACECSLADYLDYVLGAAARHEADCRRLARIRAWAEARSGRTGADDLPAGGARIAAAA